MPKRWLKPILRSAMTPSHWWNSAKWVISSVSFLNTLSIEKYLAGLNTFYWANLYSIWDETAVVCVLRMFFLVSSMDQSQLYPKEPSRPFSWVCFTRAAYSSGTLLQLAGLERKKVSWASRAGWLYGWKSASKFQNEDSTNLWVGISLKPIWRKISRN